jgi:hypothetical protein
MTACRVRQVKESLAHSSTVQRIRYASGHGEAKNRFDSHDAVNVRGYVVDVKKPTAGEACNCRKTDDDNIDTHIDLALNSNADAKENLVIVEVTPRTRFEAKLNGLDWSVEELTRRLKRKMRRVKHIYFYDDEHLVYFYDNKHLGQSRNDAGPGATHIWRATLWEVHPITSMETINCASLL